MIRTRSFAMVVAAVSMSPLLGLAQPTAAPAAGSDVRPTVSALAPVRASTDLPPKPLVPCESQQTTRGTDWMPLLVAMLGFVGTLGGVWVTGRLNAHHARQIEDLKKGFEFRLSSDRTVLDKRMHHYERLLGVLQNFPKYPEPRALGAAALKTIATMLQDLYFGGAGIYMSPDVRDGYFDLQDGIRVVLSKTGQIILSLPDPRDDAALRNLLQRPDGWKIPAPITALRTLTTISEPLPPEVLAQIRQLGSELRTRMAHDLDSRRELSDRGAHQSEDTRTRSV